MTITEDIKAALAENPDATKFTIPLARAEELTDAVLSGGAEFHEDVYPLRIKTFLGLEFLGADIDQDKIRLS